MAAFLGRPVNLRSRTRRGSPRAFGQKRAFGPAGGRVRPLSQLLSMEDPTEIFNLRYCFIPTATGNEQTTSWHRHQIGGHDRRCRPSGRERLPPQAGVTAGPKFSRCMSVKVKNTVKIDPSEASQNDKNEGKNTRVSLNNLVRGSRAIGAPIASQELLYPHCSACKCFRADCRYLIHKEIRPRGWVGHGTNSVVPSIVRVT